MSHTRVDVSAEDAAGIRARDARVVAPVGFKAIRLRFSVDTDAPQEKLDQLLKLTERYCVVYQTLARGPALETRLARA